MHILTTRYTENRHGPFYVTTSCISCDTCSGVAPFSFTLTEDGDHAFVYAQPKTPHEKKLCNDALESCPVAAIERDAL